MFHCLHSHIYKNGNLEFCIMLCVCVCMYVVSSPTYFFGISVLTSFYSHAVDNTNYKEAEKENLVQQSIPSNACSSLEVKGTISKNTPAQSQR